VANPLLTLMMFPQRWRPETGTLEIRVAALPFTDPLSPLVAGQPAFADTDLSLQVRVIPSLARLPQSADANPPMSLPPVARANRRALLEHLRERFRIAPAPAAPPPAIGSRRVKKYLPVSYRTAFAFPGPQHPYVSTDHTYRCAFESAQKADENLKPEDRVTWGEILGYVLRNRLIAEEAGLLFGFDVAPGDAFAGGGWLYAELQPGTPFAGLPPPAVRRYAARIPALGVTGRPVFAAIQFPVDDASASDDARVFIEAETYADGFAKIVHGAQPIAFGPIGTEPGGPAPVRDRGIRLGWDDEQIDTWLNRQIDLDPYRRAAPKLAARLSVLGYRVDVRRVGDVDGWISLQRVQGRIQLDAIAGPPVALPALDLGLFGGELPVETIPLNIQGKKDGDYWLPTHFVSWAGGSLVLSDPAALSIDNRDDLVAAQRYTAVGADTLALRYGQDYEFRVRLMDLSSGGPRADEKFEVLGAAPIALVKFRRYVPPNAPLVTRSDGGPASDPPSQIEVHRPRLGYPDIVFALGSGVIPDLLAERDRVLALPEDQRVVGVGLPDPDAVAVRITVAVRQLAMDETEFLELYTVERAFLADAALPLAINIEYADIHDVSSMAAPGDGEPLRIPTARDVRLTLQTVGRDTPNYFGSDAARFSPITTVMRLRANSRDETGLFASQTLSERIRGLYLQPDPPVTGFTLFMLSMEGVRQPPALDAPHRLAQALDLECDTLTMWAKQGRRTLIGASAALQHQLGVDHASITFSSQTDLVRHWIIAIHVKLDRDWTWDALQAQGVRVYRDGNFVGTVDLPRVVNRNALVNANRARVELIFFDAIDPKPQPGTFPEEIEVSYRIEPVFRTPPAKRPDEMKPDLRLPITTPPAQTAKLVSAGLALTPFASDERYASTSQRRRMLWLEFDRPPDDKHDRYYGRVLASSPDPMLVSPLLSPADGPPEPPEPPLPIDPEAIRVIVPEQSADDCGLDAMQELLRSPDIEGAVHYLVPLPDGMDETSLELFGFFTYELRVGHNADRWSTCHGRFGPPLRVTGVQHPMPPLVCQVSRAKDRIEVRAPFATPVVHGVPVRPIEPRTDMWVLLYAQVLQVDGKSWRNVLMTQVRAERLGPRQNEMPRPLTALEFASARFTQDTIDPLLATLGLPANAPLSVLAVELIPETVLGSRVDPPRRDPLHESLGEVRVLRTSPLVPVPPVC
jgi:hypothetical protein